MASIARTALGQGGSSIIQTLQGLEAHQMPIGRRDLLTAATTAALVAGRPVQASVISPERRRSYGIEDALASSSIMQLMSEWGHEVDSNYGRGMKEADLLTEDCRCKLAEQWVVGIDAIADFYKARAVDFKSGQPRPIYRQLFSNFRIELKGRDEAQARFHTLLFYRVGKVPFSDYCEPVEVADTRVDCRRGADGLWRINMLEADRIFRRD